jgi:hypothetical protein
MMRSRRGDWIQIFMLIFFVLILILCIALLSLEKGSLKNEREQLGVDLMNQDASAQLIALLRSPASGGFEGDGRKVQIADIIVINSYNATLKRGAYDDMLLHSLELAVPKDLYFELIMTYPDGSMYMVSNTEYDGAYKLLLKDRGQEALENELSNKATNPQWRSQKVPAAITDIVLPTANGNVKLEYYISVKNGVDAAKIHSERTEGKQ